MGYQRSPTILAPCEALDENNQSACPRRSSDDDPFYSIQFHAVTVPFHSHHPLGFKGENELKHKRSTYTKQRKKICQAGSGTIFSNQSRLKEIRSNLHSANFIICAGTLSINVPVLKRTEGLWMKGVIRAED